MRADCRRFAAGMVYRASGFRDGLSEYARGYLGRVEWPIPGIPGRRPPVNVPLE